MANQKFNNKKGFTIIEVVLVLGIAGLIFLMVFIALPTLQRNRRDTQRESDISRLSAALTNFQTNNSGAIPSDKFGSYVSGHTEPDPNITRTLNHQSWAYFYDSYLIISKEDKDKFVDPEGNPYSLSISSCREATSYNADTKICNNGQRSNSSWRDQAEFVIGAVGNIAAVCRLFVFLRHAGNDDASREAEEAVKLAQFLAVAAGKVVVNGNDVYAFAGECVQIHRQRCHQCFPFTGAHFRDFALMQDDTADHLHVVMAQAEYTLARFAHHGKRFGQDLIQRLALAQALAEFDGFCFQRVIIQCLHLWFERIDFADRFAVLLDQAFVTGAKNFCGDIVKHRSILSKGLRRAKRAARQRASYRKRWLHDLDMMTRLTFAICVRTA